MQPRGSTSLSQKERQCRHSPILAVLSSLWRVAIARSV